MTAEFWAIIGVGVALAYIIPTSIAVARSRLERKLDILIEEVRYANLEAQKRDMMGADRYNETTDML